MAEHGRCGRTTRSGQDHVSCFPIFLGTYLFQGSIRIEVGIWRKVNEKEVQTLFGESDCLPCGMGW